MNCPQQVVSAVNRNVDARDNKNLNFPCKDVIIKNRGTPPPSWWTVCARKNTHFLKKIPKIKQNCSYGYDDQSTSIDSENLYRQQSGEND